MACVLTPLLAYGQSYNTTAGLRLGDGIGMTIRQRVLKRTSIEGIFYQHHKSDQTIAGIMAAHHMPVLTRRLNLYIGGGPGWIFANADEGNSSSDQAIMGNAGLEFTLGKINLSWDFIPVIPMSREGQGLTTLTAFSLRYVVFKKSKGNKKGIFEGHKKKKSKRNKKRNRRQ